MDAGNFSSEKPTKQSFMDTFKAVPKPALYGVPIGFFLLLLVGAKVLDSTSPTNNKVTPPTTSKPAATAAVESKPVEKAPVNEAGGVPTQPTATTPAEANTSAQAMVAGNAAPSNSNMVQGTQIMPTENQSEDKEKELLKQQLRAAQAEIDRLTQQANRPTEVVSLRPRYTNKPLNRKPSGSFATVGDRRWDEGRSYLVK